MVTAVFCRKEKRWKVLKAELTALLIFGMIPAIILLVSDVLVMARDGENKAYYVDEQGWTELPDFVEQRKRVVELTDKMWYAPVTMNSTGVEVEQHEGLWHPVERRIVQDEIFYLMQHNEYGNSVNGVMVDSMAR